MNVRFSDENHCSSVTLRKPSTRGVTAPTLLTKMSITPPASAASTRTAGPPGVDRSTATGVTEPVAANSSSPALLCRAPATT